MISKSFKNELDKDIELTVEEGLIGKTLKSVELSIHGLTDSTVWVITTTEAQQLQAALNEFFNARLCQCD